MKRETWRSDRLTKSEFFLSRCQQWKIVDIGKVIDNLHGEKYDWTNLEDLEISQVAWSRVIHRSVKPVRVFAHPKVFL